MRDVERHACRVVCALLLTAQAGFAQQMRTQGGEPRTRSLADSLMAAPQGTQLSTEPLDAPVKRSEYNLGPGDRLDVALLGEISRSYPIVVAPEGTVTLPGIGVIPVLGLNLDAAEEQVRRLVARYFRNVDVRLTLAAVRRFKVFVVGDTPARGVQIASSVTRVSEILPAHDSTIAQRRNITVRRLSGDSVHVDLVRFHQTGDIGANPVLREGDIVMVTAADETVRIMGRVVFPGDYEYRSGETLADLLWLANGGGDFPSDAADSLFVTRFVGAQQREHYSFPRAEALGATGKQLALQPFDAVYVPGLSNFREQKVATIRGQVERPGTYPIRPDTTTIRDLVAMAGGLTENASLVNASLRRDTTGVGNIGLETLQRIPHELLSEEERRILLTASSADQSAVVTDFQALFTRGMSVYDQVLHEDDVINIPERRDEVLVVGAVARPGVVAFTSGFGATQFVERAGGFTRLADRGATVILRARGGGRVGYRETRALEAGDVIVVPFRQRRDLLGIIQTVGVVVGTLSSIVLTYIAITR